MTTESNRDRERARSMRRRARPDRSDQGFQASIAAVVDAIVARDSARLSRALAELHAAWTLDENQAACYVKEAAGMSDEEWARIVPPLVCRRS